MTIQHVVLFKFPTALDEDEELEFRSIVARWPSEVGTMTNLRLGQDMRIVGDRSQGYQYLLFMEFPDVKALTDYRAHEAHVALSTFIRPRGCVVLAFDYELDDRSIFS